MRLISLFVILVLAHPVLAVEKASREGVEFFEKHVRPVLIDKCISCHGPKVQRGGLRLDSRAALLKGGDSGPALLVGQPEKSLLIRAVRRTSDLKMPPRDRDRLDDKTINDLVGWVKLGAPWPEGGASTGTESSIAQARASHWAFRSVVRPAVPSTENSAWAITPIDRFILARLEAKRLSPSPRADRRTLLRRVTFDLTGLPPTPEEVESFLGDNRLDAYERVVDRLLASPAYGERWGRHWLDVARYADTKGYVFQEERRYPYAYTYRDYVVGAFNADVPYDRFLIEQIAADRLSLGDNRRPLAAMGFLTLGRRFLNNVHDIIDDRLDVVTRGLMGLTVACARCHDHKYDPISSRDYYSLYGVFASSQEPGDLPLLEQPDPTSPPSAFEQELRKRQAEMDTYLAKQHAEMVPRYRAKSADYLLAVRDGRRSAEGRTSDLHRQMLMRWRDYLTKASKTHHPVLHPWFEFARLSDEEFAKKAPALAKRIAENNDPKSRIDPAVARAFAGQPPASLAEVAQRYANLFKDEKHEPIRQLLHGANAPANVPLDEAPRYLDRAQRNRYMALKRRVDEWRATGQGGPPRAMVLVDAATPFNPQVFLRGNPGNRGVSVPRQFLEILSPDRKPFTQGSGRLELARAIASPDNPLTARVFVNRLWMHHFGRGLVTTPGNFGLRGEAPSHPELLDWLASELVASGWSIKAMHRRMVLSAVYRQSSEDNDRGATIDSDNTLLWRMNRRRLEFEPLRDALLAVAGTLDRHMGGPAVEITRSPFPPRRSVYAFIERQNLPGVFRTFDLASPDVSTPQRHATTVPQQSLFLMNSPFVRNVSRAFISRPELANLKDEARIDRLHRLAYARPAEAEEMQLGLAFIRGVARNESSAGREDLSAWEQYAQVLLLANEFAFVD